ncbi:SDR family NAD(P)-dependent oxidoreductase [Mycolicibacterium sp.]|uniref:SDR family NAD(P)-dependent oxidoreductase n=1 Tax=Mycolicibacterium sp. TaxID=2320850 RepID=UPI0037C51C30
MTVVTGAGAGIGRAIAARLAREGARVVVNDLDVDRATSTARDIDGIAVPGSTATIDGARAIIAAAENAYGPIDIWFANAGVDAGRGLAASDEAWTSSVEVNLMAHVRAARLLMKGWLGRGSGRFVVTASAAGLLTMLDSPAYSVTKHAAVAFAEWLSVTYRHRGIVVQAICPEAVRTQMYEDTGAVKAVLSHDAVLTPDEVADAVWDGLQDNRFLILPHPRVADYYRRRADHTDEWLESMNRLQQRLESGRATA